MADEKQPLPTAKISLQGKTVLRGTVKNDHGTRLQWKITKDGKPLDSVDARNFESHSLADAEPGKYEVVLETWRHDGYKSKGLGEYIEISNKLAVTI